MSANSQQAPAENKFVWESGTPLIILEIVVLSNTFSLLLRYMERYGGRVFSLHCFQPFRRLLYQQDEHDGLYIRETATLSEQR